jgi:protein gp37
MGQQSKIEWTDATWTPIRAHYHAHTPESHKVGWHCEHVSEGCRHCYAESINKRLGTGLEFKPGHAKDVVIVLDEKMLTMPLRWKKPRMVFVCSMTDLFADFVPDEFIDKMFAVMALCPQHTFQILTKRPERMREYFNALGRSTSIAHHVWNIDHVRRASAEMVPLSNVWLGVSVENQTTADDRIPLLLQTPAAVRFLSCEPLLGPIDLQNVRWMDGDAEIRMDVTNGEAWVENTSSAAAYTNEADGNPKIDWVICGGESGHGARPMHPDWARSLRDQCEAAGVALFFKQWGEFEHVNVSSSPEQHFIANRVGKGNAGHQLDGREHHAFPKVAFPKAAP